MNILLTYLAITLAAADAPLSSFTKDWQHDPVWNDGQAECATYEAVRIIYGQPRSYIARAYTNREHASAQTFTKSDDHTGRAVFKQHWREDIATENYNYHYSTMCYVGFDDLKSLKLDLGSQEDCGSSFKQIINHAGELTWQQFSYFPRQGHREGTLEPTADLVFFNALPTVLRGYRFDAPAEVRLRIVPDQTSTRWTPVQPEDYSVVYVGQTTLELPAGTYEAHELELRFLGPTREMRPPLRYWFAADAKWRNIMLKAELPHATTYQLKTLERRAYWQ